MHCVITTIQEPTKCVHELVEKLNKNGHHLIVIGDKKGPISFDIKHPECLTFLTLQAQLESSFSLSRKLPTGHYARKNLGYLEAMRKRATCIYETDDDNAPNDVWEPREAEVKARVAARCKSNQWVNAYKYFSSENIWPRGLPLNEIVSEQPELEASKDVLSYIQQGLVDNSPDVDAIWRLVSDRQFKFIPSDPVFLESGNWCPFNTQSTWWWPPAYPLLYIPSYCTFRMCDIWKSFIAQRCLWALDSGIVFHPPEVYQERNVHNLMNDFEDEIPGYLKNNQIKSILQNLTLIDGKDSVIPNLRTCYQALIDAGIFPAEEMDLVEAWIKDYTNCTTG